MNAASILKIFFKKKRLKLLKKKLLKFLKSVGSDVILGMRLGNSILTSKNKLKYFK